MNDTTRAATTLVDMAGKAVLDLRRPSCPVDAPPPGDMPADQPGGDPPDMWPMTGGSMLDHKGLTLHAYATTGERSFLDASEGAVELMLRLLGAGGCSHHQGVAVHQHAADRLRDSPAEFDLGYWTRHDLRYRAPASLAYHCLHTALLTAAGSVLADPRRPAVATAWDRSTRSPAGQLRAAAGKSRFVLGERRAGS
ncbi:hypothetical protein [Streptomyces sp. NPDC050121]|uniref:hypothetical protein n=1 Tax=Streptomyces sp. NPDC050121 TaxID=3365601 RepID=UPI00379515CC